MQCGPCGDRDGAGEPAQACDSALDARERRDPAEILPRTLPDPIDHVSHREFVRKVIANEVDLRARGADFIRSTDEDDDAPSVRYREQLNRAGSPSETIAADYQWRPGGELVASFAGRDELRGSVQ